MSAQRSFLFLQGMATRFFAKLGLAVAERGHDVHRINFNGGDRLFWPGLNAVDFRQPAAAWPDFLRDRLVEWSVTDIILFGDCRPLHRVAVQIARQHGIRVFVVDEGYIRPNFVTVEQGGVNGFSCLPRDPLSYLNAVPETPEWDGGKTVTGSFARRAIEDIAYNFATVALSWYYPGYRTHRPWHPFVEYWGWLRRLVRKPFTRPGALRAARGVLESNQPFFMFPLQLDCDSQIREHSEMGRLTPWIEYVIESFGRLAPPGTRLVVKEHPLDNGIYNWGAMIREKAAANLSDRIVYLEDGDLQSLLDRCQGVVTVNSTVGFLALASGKPVKTLGNAIYDMPGLTCQQTLDEFWLKPCAPDAAIFDAFRRVTAARTQVNGGFFSKAALELTVAGTIDRLEDQPFEQAFALARRVVVEDHVADDHMRVASIAL